MQLQPTTVMEVSWSADHRVVDGATIAEVLSPLLPVQACEMNSLTYHPAQFSNLFKQHLESPHTMLLNLR
jgi:hypothetical protein